MGCVGSKDEDYRGSAHNSPITQLQQQEQQPQQQQQHQEQQQQQPVAPPMPRANGLLPHSSSSSSGFVRQQQQRQSGKSARKFRLSFRSLSANFGQQSPTSTTDWDFEESFGTDEANNSSSASPSCRRRFDRLNLNSANAEQLMTLPGVTRPVAEAIVAYRREIGGRFHCAEDLAFVPGIGGLKIGQILPEVCVSGGSGRRRGRRLQQQRLQQALAVLNTSSVEALAAALPQLTEQLAEAIVRYRGCQPMGKFQHLQQLHEVPELSRELASSVADRLLLEADPVAKKLQFELQEQQLQLRCARQLSDSQLCLLTESGIFAKPYSRPPTTVFNGCLAGRRVLRLASWNLCRFGCEKASNPGVLEVVCCTILENCISLLAVQELCDQAALQRVRDELNCPTLPAVRKWRGQRGQWECCVSKRPIGRGFQSGEFAGFLYNTARGVQYRQAAELEPTSGRGSNGRAFTRSPYIGHFVVQSLSLVLVCLHLKAVEFNNNNNCTGNNNKNHDANCLDMDSLVASEAKRTAIEVDYLPDIVSALQQQQQASDKHVILLGDFNLGPDHAAFGTLRHLHGYESLIGEEQFTNISKECPLGSRCYDQIWVAPATKRLFTGHAFVIRAGLSHPLIPANWSFGGTVSDHCPVYAELYTE